MSAKLKELLERSASAPPRALGHAYVNKDEEFQNQDSQETGQYAHLYFVRYAQTRPYLVERLAELRHFPHLKFKEEIKDLKPQDGEVCFVAIIIKKMKLTPSVLIEGGSDFSTILGYKKAESYISPSEDQLFLEDPSGRLQVNTKLSPMQTWNLSNGIVVAVKGTLLDDMRFMLKEVILAGPPPAPPLPEFKEDVYVAFVSGLELGRNQDFLSLESLKGFCEGAIYPELSSKVARLVIAGNSLSNVQKIEKVVRGSYRYKQLNSEVFSQVGELRNQLDAYLALLTRSIPLDLMPGENDLSSVFLPQLPMPKFIFPLSFGDPKSREDMACLSVMAANPHCFELEGVRFLGTSGDNVQSFMSQADVLDEEMPPEMAEVATLEYLLQSRHLCPTAPEMIRCTSMLTRDSLALTPFPLKEAKQDIGPHIFFAGNMERFGFKKVEGSERSWVLSVPKFSKTREIALVNLRTMEAKRMEFKTLPGDYS